MPKRSASNSSRCSRVSAPFEGGGKRGKKFIAGSPDYLKTERGSPLSISLTISDLSLSFSFHSCIYRDKSLDILLLLFSWSIGEILWNIKLYRSSFWKFEAPELTLIQRYTKIPVTLINWLLELFLWFSSSSSVLGTLSRQFFFLFFFFFWSFYKIKIEGNKVSFPNTARLN